MSNKKKKGNIYNEISIIFRVLLGFIFKCNFRCFLHSTYYSILLGFFYFYNIRALIICHFVDCQSPSPADVHHLAERRRMQ